MPPPTQPYIPVLYRLFFLYIEPISTIVGFYCAWFQPLYYLQQTHPASAPVGSSKFLSVSTTTNAHVPIGTEVVLRQLANLYLAFTLNEALVLRVTTDLKVWRTLLLGLLIADFGHLYSCSPLGLPYYYDVQSWNAMTWGNIAFVYCGATLRTCFLLGVGVGDGSTVKKAKAKARKSIKAAVSTTPEKADGISSPGALDDGDSPPATSVKATPRNARKRKSTKST